MHARTRLLSRSPDVRLAALSDLDPHCTADVYAARAALLSDTDGRVRADAAQVLAKSVKVDPVRWLHDATYDDRPSVREAAARALGLCPQALAPSVQHRLSHLARLDPIWWVRRTATLSLARSGHREAIGTIKQVLGDPFWRVRHAAIRALETLWHALPDEREQILTVTQGMSEAALGAQLELQARVEPALASYKAEAPRPTDQALANPDPAVTTARLRARPHPRRRSDPPRRAAAAALRRGAARRARARRARGIDRIIRISTLGIDPVAEIHRFAPDIAAKQRRRIRLNSTIDSALITSREYSMDE